MDRDRDAQAVFAVRFLILVSALSLLVALLIAEVAKVVAPSHHVGHLAMTVAWPAGAALALLVHWRWRRRV